VQSLPGNGRRRVSIAIHFFWAGQYTVLYSLIAMHEKNSDGIRSLVKGHSD
jgi:hypothetical protein